MAARATGRIGLGLSRRGREPRLRCVLEPPGSKPVRVHSTQTLRNAMESLENPGQKKRRHLKKALKKRPYGMPS